MNTTGNQITGNTLSATLKALLAGALLTLAVGLLGLKVLAQDHMAHYPTPGQEAIIGKKDQLRFSSQVKAGDAVLKHGMYQVQELKAPHTAQEHREHAEQYQKKAAEYRKEAEAHRKMLADYSKTVARNPKDPNENAYIKKMRLHCEKYSKAAEALALEADEMAKFHTMRAKEVEGK